MKKNIFGAVMLSSMSLGFNAHAITWTGTEDLSSVNAEIACVTGVCTLTAVDSSAVISEQIVIDGVSSLNELIFSASDGVNRYSLEDSTSSLQDEGLLQLSNLNLVNLEVNGDITNTISTASAIDLDTVNVETNNVVVDGDIASSGVQTIVMENSSIDQSLVISGNISNTYSDAKQAVAVLFNGTTVSQDVTITGTISSTGKVIQMIEGAVLGSVTNSGTVTAGKQGVVNLTSGEIIGSITNTASGIMNAGNQVAIRLEGNVGGYIENSGTINGNIIIIGSSVGGIRLYDGTWTGELRNGGMIKEGFIIEEAATYDGPVINDGSIINTTGSAIEYQGTTDDVLNYSGVGSLSGAVYSIDMADGNDTLNMTNTSISNLSINSAETITISASTLALNITNENKGSTLITTTGATSLTLSDVVFDIANTATISNGDQLTLFAVDTISIDDLSSLSANLSGAFSIVDNSGTDELVFTYSGPTLGEASIAADQPVSGTPTASGAITLASVGSAIANTTGINEVLSGRVKSQRIAEMMKGAKFAQASSVQSDVNTIFSSAENLKNGGWIQGFGQSDKYDGTTETGGNIISAGYDSTMYGVTAGYDYKISRDILLGAAFTYSMGEVDGVNNTFETDVNSVQFSAYGSYNVGEVYMDAILGYGMGSYEQQRFVSAGDMADAEYESTQFSAQLNVGRVFFVTEKLLMTPFAKALYIGVEQDAYKESGSSSDLSVEAVSIESAQAGAGLEMSYLFETAGKSKWLPRIHVEYANEMGDNALPINATVISGGAAGTTLTTPNMGSDIFRAGGGLTYIMSTGHNISFDYQHESRENYSSDSLYIKGKYLF